MRSWIIIICLIFFSGFWTTLRAQNTGSPYTSLGIGVMQPKGLTYHQNMGGLGISSNNAWVVNNLNPALLPYNTFTTFEAALTTESRVITSDTLSQKNLSGNLEYLLFSFPLKTGKSTFSMGLMPYSNVSYKMETLGTVEGNTTKANYSYQGSGGINEVFVAAGWKLFKGFYLGIRASYLFSSIDDISLIQLYDAPEDSVEVLKNYYAGAHSIKTRFSDFIFEPGIAYIIKIADKTTLNLGATYEIATKVNTYRSETLEMRRGPEIALVGDTLYLDKRYSTQFPTRMAFGVSLNKFLNWSVGMDFHYEKWESYKNYQGNNEGLKNSMKIILGGEITPDIASVTNYLHRITYQAGFYYEKTPIYVKNRQIDDYGMNFGVSLPISNASLLTVGVNFGQMGTLSDHLIKENYIKFKLGLSFNDRSFGWYRKQRKFN